MNIELTSEQSHLVKNLMRWFRLRSKPYYSFTGAAGTGKTVCIEAFIEALHLKRDEVACAAYVGKAVLVLLRRGLSASTIHSLIFNTYVETVKYTDEFGDTKTKQKMKFGLKSTLDPAIKLIVIDEATMVNDDLKGKILSFGIPVVFVGDKNQLPPIFGKSSVMDNPDFCLTKIMRQSEDDPIVYLSQRVLNHQPLIFGDYNNSRVIASHPMDRTLVDNYDIIISAKNKTRELFNRTIRDDILGVISKTPVIGDKMICRQNDWDYCVNGVYLTNGLIGYIEDIDITKLYKGYCKIEFKPDFMSSTFEDVSLDYKYLKTPIEDRANYGISNHCKFEYGWAITAHLSQGSEYDNVLFIDEPFWDKETTKHLQYTAITRAAKSITIVKSFNSRGVYK